MKLLCHVIVTYLSMYNKIYLCLILLASGHCWIVRTDFYLPCLICLYLINVINLSRSCGVVVMNLALHVDSPGSMLAGTIRLETLGKFLKRHCLSLIQAYDF